MLEKLFSLKDKVAVVTGGSRGRWRGLQPQPEAAGVGAGRRSDPGLGAQRAGNPGPSPYSFIVYSPLRGRTYCSQTRRYWASSPAGRTSIISRQKARCSSRVLGSP